MAIYLSGDKKMTGLVRQYLDNNKKLPTSIPGLRWMLKRGLIKQGLPTREVNPNKNLAVICDAGLEPFDRFFFVPPIPFIADIHLPDALGRGRYAIDWEFYKKAAIISTDSDTLRKIGIEPGCLIEKYELRSLLVHNKLHSIWFTALDVFCRNAVHIKDFKYEDGTENEANFETKREIVAGLAAEFVLNDYTMLYEGVDTVFRQYWYPHLESSKNISYLDALKFLELKACKCPCK
ncbi:MAG: hypothetical protein LBB23_01860 [Rickettsiales bacterium]|jgi:hypothetical protein|nr:hypothetical protein [Rickettsiales bacterium]